MKKAEIKKVKEKLKEFEKGNFREISVNDFASEQMKYTLLMKILMGQYKRDKANIKELIGKLDFPKIILPCSMRFDVRKISNFNIKTVEFDISLILTLRVKLSITEGILDKN